MGFLEEVRQLTREANGETDEDRAKQIELNVAAVLDEAIHDVDNAIIATAREGENYLTLGIRDYFLAYVDEDDELDYLVELVVRHYNELGFQASKMKIEIDICWEEDEIVKAKRAKLKAQIADVQSARILSSFIIDEDYEGELIEIVMHTVRLIHQDGHKSIVTAKEEDPFFQGIIDKLEN